MEIVEKRDLRQIAKYRLPKYFADENGVRPIEEFPINILIHKGQLANLLDCNLNTFYRWEKEGIISTIKVGDYEGYDVKEVIESLKKYGYRQEE